MGSLLTSLSGCHACDPEPYGGFVNMVRIITTRLLSQLSCCNRVPCLLSSRPGRLLVGQQLLYSTRQSGLISSTQHRLLWPHQHQVTSLANSSDLSTEKYSMIYHLPHIKLLRAISRLKLLQTGITMAILPPVFYFYSTGDLSYFLVSYSTGVAMLAGVMLYTVSHFLRRVVGMMYLDSAGTTMKVSHLTFWGRRTDVCLPVSDVMTIADTGDALTEVILKLKRYSSAETMYFSTKYGLILDKQAFEKVFGSFH